MTSSATARSRTRVLCREPFRYRMRKFVRPVQHFIEDIPVNCKILVRRAWHFPQDARDQIGPQGFLLMLFLCGVVLALAIWLVRMYPSCPATASIICQPR